MTQQPKETCQRTCRGPWSSCKDRNINKSLINFSDFLSKSWSYFDYPAWNSKTLHSLQLSVPIEMDTSTLHEKTCQSLSSVYVEYYFCENWFLSMHVLKINFGRSYAITMWETQSGWEGKRASQIKRTLLVFSNFTFASQYTLQEKRCIKEIKISLGEICHYLLT